MIEWVRATTELCRWHNYVDWLHWLWLVLLTVAVARLSRRAGT